MESSLDITRPPVAWSSPSKSTKKALLFHTAAFVFSVAVGMTLGVTTTSCNDSGGSQHPVSWNTPPAAHHHEKAMPCICPATNQGESFSMPVYDSSDHTMAPISHQSETNHFQSIRFEGNIEVPSKYKGPPTPEVDAAWDALWAANMLIPQDLYHKSAPRYPEASVSDHHRPDMYFATFEATHQLHCLYTLFRASYVDYYEPERNFLLHDPDRYHARLDHCTDMLRQKLMCDADANVVTYNWVKNQSRPVPDYSVMHQCRSYDTLLEWSEKHAATGAVFVKGQSVELDSEP